MVMCERKVCWLVFFPICANEKGCHELFVEYTDAQQVVSVVSLVKPWDRTKFMRHLCLSLGTYVTEVDLFTNGSIHQAFMKCGLFPDGRDVTRADLLSVMRRYIIEDLRFHPISARQFGKYVTAAMSTLVDMMHDQTI